MTKLLALLLASTALVGCEKTGTKLDGSASGGTSNAGVAVRSADHTKLIESLRKIEERLAAFEALHKPGSGGPDLPIAERLHRIEVSLAVREESLGFLEMAYAQQKRQEEMKEAQELDPSGVYAVDISKALAAGQVEGPNSAIVTVVEAWDFA
jgi:hypothetical protein